VIIGKLIPAGTGMSKFRNIKVFEESEKTADLLEEVEMEYALDTDQS
jgi:hypothetical protein